MKMMKDLKGQTLEEETTMKVVPHCAIQVPNITEVPIEIKKQKNGEIIGDNLLVETILIDTTKVDAGIGAKKQQVIHRPKLRWFSLLAMLN